MPDDLPQTEPGIDAFIAAFEDGTLPKARWTHAAHLFTGACYVHEQGEDLATARMRDRVAAFNVAVGGQNTPTTGYHETVTVFWIKLLAQFHAANPALDRASFAHLAVRECAHRRDIYRKFYDFDLLASVEARRRWFPPTIREISVVVVSETGPGFNLDLP